jgi:hypothetical protein
MSPKRPEIGRTHTAKRHPPLRNHCAIGPLHDCILGMAVRDAPLIVALSRQEPVPRINAPLLAPCRPQQGRLRQPAQRAPAVQRGLDSTTPAKAACGARRSACAAWPACPDA